MTASAEEEVLVTVGETLGSAAGKVVAAAKRTASTLTDEKRKIAREPSPDAMPPGGEFAPESGAEIVPTDSAKQLVAYLLSLRADTVIFETPVTVPMPSPSTNAPAVTNATAAAAATNAPAK